MDMLVNRWKYSFTTYPYIKSPQGTLELSYIFFSLPDCCRFNSGPQKYVQVVTPGTCKDDLICKTIFMYVIVDFEMRSTWI